MSREIVFLPEAREEFDTDADWYENRQAGLGARFTLAVNAVLERIAKNPKMHAVVLDDARKAVVSGFPYCVYYREDGDRVVVLWSSTHRATRRNGKGAFELDESSERDQPNMHPPRALRDSPPDDEDWNAPAAGW